MKWIAIISASLAVFSTTPVSAEAGGRIDLNTVKCGEWIESGTDNIGATMTWLDGYYTNDNDPPVIDFDKMKEKAKKLGKFCAENRDLGLGTAAEKLLGGGK
jgi:acid stress chaperone HdeB